MVETAEQSETPRVAVAITTHTVDLGPPERVSLERAIEVLGPRRDLYLVVPASLDVSAALAAYPALRHLPVADEFFGGRQAHNRMLLSPTFYTLFGDVEFVLVHHLDAYVFRDDLDRWCDARYDYVGAPWIAFGPDSPFQVDGVGSGGLSLRRAATFRRVAAVLEARPTTAVGRLLLRLPYRVRAALREAARPLASRLPLGDAKREGMLRLLNRGFDAGEDIFWGLRVAPWLPWFRVAPTDEALEFAFDLEPERMYERNGRQLPMGCHGWPDPDRTFWRTFIDVPVEP